jgi:hypothetical protein
MVGIFRIGGFMHISPKKLDWITINSESDIPPKGKAIFFQNQRYALGFFSNKLFIESRPGFSEIIGVEIGSEYAFVNEDHLGYTTELHLKFVPINVPDVIPWPDKKLMVFVDGNYYVGVFRPSADSWFGIFEFDDGLELSLHSAVLRNASWAYLE